MVVVVVVFYCHASFSLENVKASSDALKKEAVDPWTSCLTALGGVTVNIYAPRWVRNDSYKKITSTSDDLKK